MADKSQKNVQENAFLITECNRLRKEAIQYKHRAHELECKMKQREEPEERTDSPVFKASVQSQSNRKKETTQENTTDAHLWQSIQNCSNAITVKVASY